MVDISLLGYQKGHEEFFIGQVPYLFKSQEWAGKIYNSEVFGDFYDRLRDEKDIRVPAVAGDHAPSAPNGHVPNRPAFQALSKDVYKSFEGDLWREGLVEEIQAMQEQEESVLK